MRGRRRGGNVAVLELSRQLNKIVLVQPRTKRQKEVLEYVTRFIERNGHEPSYQQIARHLGVSSRSGVQRHIEALEGQGLIARKRENHSFRIELLSEPAEAGSVCRIEFRHNGTGARDAPLSVARSLLGPLEPAEVFAVRVPDDSMDDHHIFENDILLFEKQDYARRSQVVFAVDGSGGEFIRQYYNHGTEVELKPANSTLEELVLPADEVRILGVMRGLIRPIPPID